MTRFLIFRQLDYSVERTVTIFRNYAAFLVERERTFLCIYILEGPKPLLNSSSQRLLQLIAPLYKPNCPASTSSHSFKKQRNLNKELPFLPLLQSPDRAQSFCVSPLIVFSAQLISCNYWNSQSIVLVLLVNYCTNIQSPSHGIPHPVNNKQLNN